MLLFGLNQIYPLLINKPEMENPYLSFERYIEENEITIFFLIEENVQLRKLLHQRSALADENWLSTVKFSLDDCMYQIKQRSTPNVYKNILEFFEKQIGQVKSAINYELEFKEKYLRWYNKLISPSELKAKEKRKDAFNWRKNAALSADYSKSIIKDILLGGSSPIIIEIRNSILKKINSFGNFEIPIVDYAENQYISEIEIIDICFLDEYKGNKLIVLIDSSKKQYGFISHFPIKNRIRESDIQSEAPQVQQEMFYDAKLGAYKIPRDNNEKQKARKIPTYELAEGVFVAGEYVSTNGNLPPVVFFKYLEGLLPLIPILELISHRSRINSYFLYDSDLRKRLINEEYKN